MVTAINSNSQSVTSYLGIETFPILLRVSIWVLKILISKKVPISKILVENKASISISKNFVSKKCQSRK